MLKKVLRWVRAHTAALGTVAAGAWGAWNAWHASRHGGQPFTLDAVIPLALAVWGLITHSQVTPLVRPRAKLGGRTVALAPVDRNEAGPRQV
jgi:hypothetical protein